MNKIHSYPVSCSLFNYYSFMASLFLIVVEKEIQEMRSERRNLLLEADELIWYVP